MELFDDVTIQEDDAFYAVVFAVVVEVLVTAGVFVIVVVVFTAFQIIDIISAASVATVGKDFTRTSAFLVVGSFGNFILFFSFLANFKR